MSGLREAGVSQSYVELPAFTISLKHKQTERWREVATEYGPALRGIVSTLEATIIAPLLSGIPFGLGPAVYRLVLAFVTAVLFVDAYGWFIPCSWELWGFAKHAGLPPGKLALVQFMYEACTLCTSVVVDSSTHKFPVHLRTMDWELDGIDLRPLSIVVHVEDENGLRFTGITWAGFLGMLTGMTRDRGAGKDFSVSVNYRTSFGDRPDSHDPLTNVTAGALWRVVTLCKPVGMAVRDALMEAGTFRRACVTLRDVRLISPAYFILCGCGEGEGVAITRAPPRTSLAPQLLSDGPIIQVNTDHWVVDPLEDMMDGKARKRKARKLLRRAAGGGPQDWWALLSSEPIRNEMTIYACVMVPATGEIVAGAQRYLDVDGMRTPYVDAAGRR